MRLVLIRVYRAVRTRIWRVESDLLRYAGLIDFVAVLAAFRNEAVQASRTGVADAARHVDVPDKYEMARV